jgi:hypothetical protein
MHAIVIGSRQPLMEQENDLYTDFFVDIFLDSWTGVAHRWRLCSHTTCAGCGSFHLQYRYWPRRSSIAAASIKQKE